MTGVAPSRKRCHASACPASAGALSAELCNERTVAMADQRLGGAGGSGGSAGGAGCVLPAACCPGRQRVRQERRAAASGGERPIARRVSAMSASHPKRSRSSRGEERMPNELIGWFNY